MIIELFGPSTSGKTTFAHALANRLREDGYIVDLVLSCRPAERSCLQYSSLSSECRITSVPHRLARPLLEIFSIACYPSALSRGIGATAGLVKLLPPRNVAIAARLGQYMLRLMHSWYYASATNHIVLFDQAFVQVVCSLVLFGKAPNELLIARALDCSPRSDLLIRLDAPQEMLAARLKDRLHRQSVLERLLEPDLMMNIDLLRIIDRVYELLRHGGQPVARAMSLDECSLRKSVDEIEKQVVAMLGADQKAMAS